MFASEKWNARRPSSTGSTSSFASATSRNLSIDEDTNFFDEFRFDSFYGEVFHSSQPNSCTLSNGVEMPLVGLGTSHSGGYSHDAVVYALQDCGYRLIDTAKRYGCEEMLADAIKESAVNREDLFLSSKLWPTDYGFESTTEALRKSLARLGTDYLDMFMVHWPNVREGCTNKWQTLSETWRALELAYDEGLCRAIGVSNYDSEHLEKLFETCAVKPLVNQIEFHPYQNALALRDFCRDHHIQIQGYCPLGKGHILNDEPIKRIANKYGKTSAQVLIRWSIQNDVATIPKSTRESRVHENIQVFDFEIDASDMNVLNGLNDGRRYVDASKIHDKINSNLPDGYKLSLPTSIRRHS